jgi:hypothetical protein
VVCAGNFGPIHVRTTTVPASIDSSECVTFPETEFFGLCSPCIRSLEDQGCDVIDVDSFVLPAQEFADLHSVFVLSCERP